MMGRKNNWYVVTGGPCSGKTSVLKILGERGYRVVQEMARTVIDAGIAQGKTLEEIRADECTFQKELLIRKYELEKTLDPNEIIFFDRAIPDSDAYYRVANCMMGEEDKSILAASRYKKVFLFELLPYEKDYARTESEEEANAIQKLLEESYRQLDIPVVHVSVMEKKEDRAEFILNNL